MGIRRYMVALLVCMVMITGCQSSGLKAYDRYRLGSARDIIALSTESIGGIETWRKVHQVRAETLLTVYDEAGQAYVNRQVHLIDINGGKITAEAQTARGHWRARYHRSGRFSLRGAEALDQITAAQLRKILGIILHRVAGPLNLLGRTERPRNPENLWRNSKDLVRVVVTGDNTHAIAYYFDANTGLLQMLTSGTDTPGHEGTVSLYEYQMLPNGVVFPKKIRIVRTGEHILVSNRLLMEMEFSDVVIN